MQLEPEQYPQQHRHDNRRLSTGPCKPRQQERDQGYSIGRQVPQQILLRLGLQHVPQRRFQILINPYKRYRYETTEIYRSRTARPDDVYGV